MIIFFFFLSNRSDVFSRIEISMISIIQICSSVLCMYLCPRHVPLGNEQVGLLSRFVKRNLVEVGFSQTPVNLTCELGTAQVAQFVFS